MVNIVHLAIRQKLNLLAGKIVNRETALFIRADNETLRRIRRVDPERRVIRRVAACVNRVSLDGRDDFLNGRRSESRCPPTAAARDKQRYGQY